MPHMPLSRHDPHHTNMSPDSVIWLYPQATVQLANIYTYERHAHKFERGQGLQCITSILTHCLTMSGLRLGQRHKTTPDVCRNQTWVNQIGVFQSGYENTGCFLVSTASNFPLTSKLDAWDTEWRGGSLSPSQRFRRFDLVYIHCIPLLQTSATVCWPVKFSHVS